MWPGPEAESFILAVGYHGAAYNGSQIQPDMPTVQGEIRAIIEELNWSENAKIRLSSRTDAGVSARMNLIDLELEPSLICLLYTSPSPRDQRGSRMPSYA